MESIHDRYLACCDVGNHLRDEEGIELRTVLLVLCIVAYFFLESLDATDAHAVDYADAVLVFVSRSMPESWTACIAAMIASCV